MRSRFFDAFARARVRARARPGRAASSVGSVSARVQAAGTARPSRAVMTHTGPWDRCHDPHRSVGLVSARVQAGRWAWEGAVRRPLLRPRTDGSNPTPPHNCAHFLSMQLISSSTWLWPSIASYNLDAQACEEEDLFTSFYQ